jgi:hypothetical protein
MAFAHRGVDLRVWRGCGDGGPIAEEEEEEETLKMAPLVALWLALPTLLLSNTPAIAQAAGGLNWSAPMHVDPVEGGLLSVSCPRGLVLRRGERRWPRA